MQRLLFFVLVFLAGATTRLAAQNAPPATEATLQLGDSVAITIFQEPSLSGKFEVNSNGKLSHPQYQDLQVAGVPLSELEARLRTMLAQYRANPQVIVEPLLTVVVSGEVIQGGVFRFGPSVTLLRAMTVSAPTETARLDRVRLIRDRVSYVADFNDPEADWIRTTVRSGDHIIVEPRLNVFRDIISPVTSVMGAMSSMISFLLFMTGQF